MSTQPDNLAPACLRHTNEPLERTHEDTRDIKRRITRREDRVATLGHPRAGLQLRTGRLEYRLERVERRLDLHEVRT